MKPVPRRIMATAVFLTLVLCILFITLIDVKSSQTKNTIPAFRISDKFDYKYEKHVNYTNGDYPFKPPTWDTNCLRQIPSQWTGATGEASILIPPLDVLKDMEDEVVACIFQRYVTSLQRHCSQPEMIGLLHKIKRPGVGGWNVCLDQKYRPSDPCLVYSFSATYQDYSFAIQIADQFHCEVHKFYKSKTKSNNHALVLNHDLWIGKDNTEKEKTLNNIMNTLGHKGRIIDVLTIDIDGEEWDVLKELITSGSLRRIRQLSIAIHGPMEVESKQEYIDRLVLLKSLYEQGFRIFWANRDWDVKFKLHPKRTSSHVLNMMKDIEDPEQHLVVPSDEVLNTMSPQNIGDFFHSYQGKVLNVQPRRIRFVGPFTAYKRYCMSMQILCREIVRMGKMISGGWDVCHDKEWRPQNPCLVYSFGINFDFSFDDEMSEFYGCEVHSFDPSMKKKDYKQAPRVYYHDSGIAGSNHVKSPWKLRTLQTFKMELGHANRHLDILKLDVEDWEWKSVPEMITSGVLKNVTQFYLEIHTHAGTPDSHSKFKSALGLMRTLYNEGYRIFWSHRNPYCIYTAKDSKKEREACYEIYFLNIHNRR